MKTQTPPNTTQIPFDQICECGTYVCNWSGHLLQIPESCIVNNAPSWNFVGNETLYCTKISDNWQVPVEEARNLCTNINVNCNF